MIRNAPAQSRSADSAPHILSEDSLRPHAPPSRATPEWLSSIKRSAPAWGQMVPPNASCVRKTGVSLTQLALNAWRNPCRRAGIGRTEHHRGAAPEGGSGGARFSRRAGAAEIGGRLDDVRLPRVVEVDDQGARAAGERLARANRSLRCEWSALEACSSRPRCPEGCAVAQPEARASESARATSPKRVRGLRGAVPVIVYGLPRGAASWRHRRPSP